MTQYQRPVSPYMTQVGLKLRHVSQLTGVDTRTLRNHYLTGRLSYAYRAGGKRERIFTLDDVRAYIAALSLDRENLDYIEKQVKEFGITPMTKVAS